jgi:predicted esterase
MKRALCLLLLLPLGPVFAEDPLPYPKGSTSQSFADLRFQLVIPADYDPAKEWSLIVVLHGNGGTETGMAASLVELTKDGFIVCAPKSTAMGWDTKDIGRVREIVKHLLDKLTVGKGRLHGMGFSNGGWNLGPLVFDEEFPFVSACWMAAGFRGGSVPKRARREMGAIALIGENDGNLNAAQGTVDALEDKVRHVECRVEPGIGHEFTKKLMPYYLFFVKAMEGRYAPGVDMSFPWTTDLAAAKARMATEERGGFIWFHSKSDAESEEGRVFQQEILFDAFVRRFGSQLATVAVNVDEDRELFEELRLKKTPAVAVLKPDFRKYKTFEGKFSPTKLAAALRGQAKDKSLPK